MPKRSAERERAYAEGVLDILSRDIEDDPEILMAYDLIDAGRLAGRYIVDDGLSVAERAAADRHWAYGHVIVDEAQEALADGLADVDAPVPEPVDDARR